MTIHITVTEDLPNMNDKVKRCATMLMGHDATVEVTWANGLKQTYEPTKTRRDHIKLLKQTA